MVLLIRINETCEDYKILLNCFHAYTHVVIIFLEEEHVPCNKEELWLAVDVLYKN